MDPAQQEAIDVVRMWGFTLKSELVWRKLTTPRAGWLQFGNQLEGAEAHP